MPKEQPTTEQMLIEACTILSTPGQLRQLFCERATPELFTWWIEHNREAIADLYRRRDE